MRILYLTQWFDPEPAFKGEEFVRLLVAQGNHVEVATGFPNYPGGRLYDGFRLRPYVRTKTASAVCLHRLWLFPSHGRSSVGRALNYLSFFISALIFLVLRGGRYDLVYAYHPPITPALAAAIARRLHRFRLIVDIQDLWPDSVMASGMVPARVESILKGLCKFVYSSADRIIAQTDGMRARIISRGIPEDRITRIYNWATYTDRGDLQPCHPPGFEGHINLLYGGNIGQAQSLLHVVRAAQAAGRSVASLRFHIFGSGIERDALTEYLAANPDCNLVLHDPVDRQTMDRIFDEADILVLHLKRDPIYEFTIPSKAQHYLACGKPIVAGIEGEAGQLLQASGAAEVTPSEDIEAMTKSILRFCSITASERSEIGRRGRAFYDENFASDAAIRRTQQVLVDAMSSSNSPMSQA